MSAREAFGKLVDDATEAWLDHTVTVDEALKVCRDLAEAATTIKDVDAKDALLEASGKLFDYIADRYDIPYIPGPAERRIEGYVKTRVLEGVSAWYDAAIGPPHAA